MEKNGKAYGFFDCEASKEAIESELPEIRNLVQTPSQLELSLMEGPNEDLRSIARAASEGSSFNHEYDLVTTAIKEGRELDKHVSRFVRLAQIIDIGKGSGVRYAMTAKYPGATNEKTADELAAVLNQAYLQKSPLYQEGEPFRGDIFYEKKGEYVFRD